MTRARSLRVSPLVLALAVGLGTPLVLSGCGGAQTETVVPDVPPAAKAKDSMDYYLKSMNEQKTGAAPAQK
jgi:hypothetical protein